MNVDLPRYSDNPNEYRKLWIKRKRKLDPSFALKQSQKARAWQLANPIISALRNYKTSARKRQLVWAITDELFASLVISPCHYCGARPNSIHGVDRVDNTIGYTTPNVVTACKWCNRAKSTMTKAEFISWAKLVVEHNGCVQ